MIGFLILFAVSIALVMLTALNLKNIVLHGRTSAYGHVYRFAESPIAFIISAACTVFAFALGLILALGGFAMIFGLTR